MSGTSRPCGRGPSPLLAALRRLVLAGAGLMLVAAAPRTSWAEETADPAIDDGAAIESPATPSPSTSDVLAVLSEADAGLYRRIFELQDAGKFQAADKLIGELSDRVLMGHVLYQRYMHPRAYRSSYEELKDWLEAYADHPDAERVYQLAAKRRPANWRWPVRPKAPVVPAALALSDTGDDEDTGGPEIRRRYSRDLNYARSRIRRWLRLGAPTRAVNYLKTPSVARLFDDFSEDEMLADIGAAYFQFGKDEETLETAGRAALRSGKYLPEANWWAGLAAWRLGRHDLAAVHFETLATSSVGDEWLASAGAYWAARAFLVTREPAKVVPMLQLAADHPLTFYGVLAVEALAMPHVIDWSLPVTSVDDARKLLEIPAARRCLALLQAGEERLAVAEFRRIARRLPPALLETLMAYADEHQLAALSYQIGNATYKRDGHWHGAALYPVPVWEPSDGFQIDRALIYALMRQESNFKTTARSHAGARGLMQLMPGTAGFISGSRFRGWRREKLYEPELNVTLGQKYIRYLLERPGIDGNLFYAVAAYNGGPGNLRKWLRTIDHRGDPLLFIESIPRRETRVYVERVLTNFWLYRDRLGQPRPSLADVVAGGWPVYSALDPLNQRVALTRTAAEASSEN